MAPKGKTAKGMGLPAGASAGSTSKRNAQVGKLKKRMHGAAGTKGYPK